MGRENDIFEGKEKFCAKYPQTFFCSEMCEEFNGTVFEAIRRHRFSEKNLESVKNNFFGTARVEL